MRRVPQVRRVAVTRKTSCGRRKLGQMPTAAVTSVYNVDELIEVRRSRRARRWTLSVPWGSPPMLTFPAWMGDEDIDRIITIHREWIAAERSKQRPRLRLDPRGVSEADARTAVRELVAMLVEEEAPRIGVTPARIQIRDQRSRWGSCSTRGTLVVQLAARACAVRRARLRRRARAVSSTRAEPLAPFLEARRAHRPDWRVHRDWLHEHGPELLAFRPAA